ncbi:AAA family ATPase [Streptomyces sp. NPDC015661]|uniref:ATP-binding protein n=1 Tax=Streptomyces sp. NPDC015661 TaxID=3364961 RepID=UPI0036FD8D7A
MWTRDEGRDARFVDCLRDGPALVGRDEELAALRAALSGHRMVTVTGAAGTGKSRLALAAVTPPLDGPWRTVVRVRWHDGIPVGRRALTARVARALRDAGPAWDPARTDLAVPDPGGPDDAVPGPAVPGPAVPGPAVPGPAVPGLAVADLGVSDPGGLDDAVPGPAVADLAVSDPGGPDDAVPGPAVPGLAVADLGVPDPGGLDDAVPGPAVAELGVSDPAVPGLAVQDSAASGPAVPGRAVPDPAVSDLTRSDLTAPDLVPPPGGVLLLLDDVDPVHTECVGLVQALLMDQPAVRVLVTARRPLGLGDEKVIRLAPLPVEAAPGRAGPSPAAELLVSLARERGWSEEADPAAVARVCGLLEGVPLALELAAGRLGEWTLEELAAHLEGGQCRLADPAPLLLRHRTLRTSIGAVHALCEPAQRSVWRRLSVFAGPFTEAAAVFVCLGSDLAPHEVPPALAMLSAMGVLQALGDAGAVCPPRYRMARAAREFGTERLAASGERPVTRDRHAVHFRGVAAVAESLWNTGLQRQALQTVRDEHDDLMALVHRGGDGTGPAETALETVLHLWFWWAVHGHAREGSDHLHVLLPRLPAAGPLVARGRWLLAWLSAAWDPRTAHHLLSLAWPAAVLAGDEALLGRIAHVHGTLAWQRQDPEAAAEYYRQAADTTPSGAPGGPPPSVSLAALAVIEAHRTPTAAARTACRALAQPSCANDAWATALAHYARAFADHRAGRTGRARYRARRALVALEAQLDAPQARRALLLLLAALNLAATATGAPTPHPRPHLPGPRDGAESPPATAGLAPR